MICESIVHPGIELISRTTRNDRCRNDSSATVGSSECPIASAPPVSCPRASSSSLRSGGRSTRRLFSPNKRMIVEREERLARAVSTTLPRAVYPCLTLSVTRVFAAQQPQHRCRPLHARPDTNNCATRLTDPIHPDSTRFPPSSPRLSRALPVCTLSALPPPLSPAPSRCPSLANPSFSPLALLPLPPDHPLYQR